MDFGDIATNLVTIIVLINFILAGILVFIERKDIGTTWAWLMVIYFIPVLGFLFYIFFGRRLRRKNFYRMSVEEKEYLQSMVDKQLQRLNDEEFSQKPLITKYRESIRMNLTSANALMTTNNEIEILNDGKDKFNTLFDDIRNAKEEINIEYYIIRRDSLGKKLRDELTKKAKDGIKVRVLYDGIGSRKISSSFYKDLIANGGEVGEFFPSIFKLINFRINNRNHRKLCIIDGKIAYIGGFNVGDEYLGLHKKFGYWRDTHLRIKGDAVQHIQGRFILDWNQATKQQTGNIKKFSFSTETYKADSIVQIISGGPSSKTQHLKNMYIKLISSAKKEVWIQTPYFVPDSSFMDACKMALLSGVDVRIMIPNKPDHPFVYWATWSYVGELLAYGAKILLYENGFLHAKTMVVDQEVATVGTTNIDNRSFELNFEINATVYDEKVATQLKQMFLEDSTVCSVLTLERYQNRSNLIKFKESISRLLSPIL
ncbi:cardiolipin synthase [Anaerobacillus alkalidiazotrophicus]|uniref:Cardiolipin synthase n=1 Tax=Anaerobacillus alkalidiazotrophicus TaxID=472963 RepID=A0A1S2MAN1_9BACI|nr:cardiolipin synthase [Anaerobacillus alkalidiazotrophicus]OIJ20765.1 cardiolipin synthase [Anaerobacillus alkalidiazotrophicus]